MGKSRGEAELAFQLRHAITCVWTREYRFHPERKWRADFAVWRDEASFEAGVKPLLVEVEGVIKGKPGRHQRADGAERDCEKYAHALLAGYLVLRVVPAQVMRGEALQWIEALMALDAKEKGS